MYMHKHNFWKFFKLYFLIANTLHVYWIELFIKICIFCSCYVHAQIDFF